MLAATRSLLAVGRGAFETLIREVRLPPRANARAGKGVARSHPRVLPASRPRSVGMIGLDAGAPVAEVVDGLASALRQHRSVAGALAAQEPCASLYTRTEPWRWWNGYAHTRRRAAHRARAQTGTEWASDSTPRSSVLQSRNALRGLQAALALTAAQAARGVRGPEIRRLTTNDPAKGGVAMSGGGGILLPTQLIYPRTLKPHVGSVTNLPEMSQ
jgi:hypothetical protein